MSTFPWMSFDNWWICRCENLLKRHFEVSSWSEDPNICARLKLFRMLWASWGHMKQCWYMLHNIFFSVSESVGDPRFVLSSIVWERRVWKFLSSCVTSCCLCKHAFWLDEMEVSRKRNIMEIHKIEWMSIDVFVWMISDQIEISSNIETINLQFLLLYRMPSCTTKQLRMMHSWIFSLKRGSWIMTRGGRYALSKTACQHEIVRSKTKSGWWFQIFLIFPLFGEDSRFDFYFSKGLKPPTRNWILSFVEFLSKGKLCLINFLLIWLYVFTHVIYTLTWPMAKL